MFGIELLDIRFRRINYNESVRPKIYDRMISERRQIAERFLSEGNGEAARIRGNRERELNKIQSEAYRSVEEIRGVADAKATEIYASAYKERRPTPSVYLRPNNSELGALIGAGWSVAQVRGCPPRLDGSAIRLICGIH